MADKTKPEALKDEELNGAQGGVWFENWIGVTKTEGSTRRGVNAGGGWDHTVKQPGTNMEVVNEDE